MLCFVNFAVFEIQVLSMLAIKSWGSFRIFYFPSAIHWQKNFAEDLAEIFVYYLSNGFDIPWHFVKGYDLFFLAVETTCSTWIILFAHSTLERLKRKAIFYLVDHLVVVFFVCPCFSRRTHSPMLEKPKI